MAAEIPARELPERALALDRVGRSEPVAGEHVGVVVAEKRPANGDAAQACQHEQMNERLSRGRHAHRLNAIAQLVARQRALLAQCALDRSDSTLRCARRHSGLRQTASVAGEQRRRRQRMQPPIVLAADELQRATVEPANHQRPLVAQSAIDIGRRQPTRARPDGETRAAQILRLHHQQPIADCDRVRGPLLTQKLGSEPRLDDLNVHGGQHRRRR